MKNNQSDTTRRISRKDTLVQTRVPTSNAKALRLTAKAAGTTVAGCLRKLVMDATTTFVVPEVPEENLCRSVDIDFLFEESSDGEHRTIKPDAVQTFTAVAPFTFHLDAIVFEGNYVIRPFYIGSMNIFGMATFPATDYPGGKVALSTWIQQGIMLSIDVSATKECQFKARLLGRRAAPRQLSEDSLHELSPFTQAVMTVVNIDGNIVLPGETKDFRATRHPPFQCDRIVVDNHDTFVLVRVEVGRDPQIDKPKKLDHSTPLPLILAHVGEEIRVFVQNTSDTATLFNARLHGLSYV